MCNAFHTNQQLEYCALLWLLEVLVHESKEVTLTSGPLKKSILFVKTKQIQYNLWGLVVSRVLLPIPFPLYVFKC